MKESQKTKQEKSGELDVKASEKRKYVAVEIPFSKATE